MVIRIKHRSVCKVTKGIYLIVNSYTHTSVFMSYIYIYKETFRFRVNVYLSAHIHSHVQIYI